jgi:HSP20 family protein
MPDDPDLTRLTRRLRLELREMLAPARWRPAADVYGIPGGWLVKVELAGVRGEEVRVLTQGRLLVVRGRRRDATCGRDLSCYRMEIVYSEFERVLELPADLERARVGTEYRDGMLLVTVTTDRGGS